MPELYRLKAESRGSEVTLILTDTHLTLEPTPEFLAKLRSDLERGHDGAAQAPRLIKWVVDKALTAASGAVDRALQPHPLSEVDVMLQHDRITVTFGHVSWNLPDLKVDPVEAFAFDFKFQEAKGVLKHK